ncbi:MAG TPA: hypothetical protein VFA52_01680 [Candidatus Paceibacterota bacterium]|nr:hypothetical protein [Candidatus Paceibacterota bacterium]
MHCSLATLVAQKPAGTNGKVVRLKDATLYKPLSEPLSAEEISNRLEVYLGKLGQNSIPPALTKRENRCALAQALADATCFDPENPSELIITKFRTAVYFLEANRLPPRICNLGEILIGFLKILQERSPELLKGKEKREARLELKKLLSELKIHQGHLRVHNVKLPARIAEPFPEKKK